MTNPTPVTTRAMIDDSGSSTKAALAWNEPAATHSKSCTVMARWPGAAPVTSAKPMAASTSEAPTAPDASLPAQARPMARPKSARTSDEMPGIRGIRGRSREALPTPVRSSIPQQILVVDVDGLSLSVQGDEDGQAHRGFGGRHYDDQKGESLALQIAHRAGASHQGEVDGVEHQLDAEKDAHQIAMKEDPGRSNQEQQRGDHQIMLNRDHERLANQVAPTSAARMRMAVASKGTR